MPRTLKLGFIGGGLNSAVGKSHFIASQMDNRWRVEAGCFSRHEDLNSQTAEAWGISPERRYPSASELLKREKNELDAVAVLTPTPTHADIVIEALEQGHNVVCEKALACSPEEGEKIKEAARKHKCFLAVTFNYTGYPMLRDLKHKIARGDLGHVHQIHVEMPQEGFARLNAYGEPAAPQAWRLKDGDVPTISLDLGVHLHHLVRFLTNEKPVELVALQENLGRFKTVIDNVMCTARYTSNLRCQFWFSKAALGHRNGLRLRVYGTRGSAEWFQCEPETLICHDASGDRRFLDRNSIDSTESLATRYSRFKVGHPSGFIEAFANHYSDIADALLAFRATGKFGSGEWVFGLDEAIEGLHMLRSMRVSSETMTWQKV
jgi:predicted dehydrogenase